MKSALVLLALLTLSAVATAQAPRIVPRASVVFAQSAPEAPSDSMNLPETHWREGFLVGGVGVGILGASALYGLCGQESFDCTGALFGGFLIGGLVGGVTGAMIGGLFPKGAAAAQ